MYYKIKVRKVSYFFLFSLPDFNLMNKEFSKDTFNLLLPLANSK